MPVDAPAPSEPAPPAPAAGRPRPGRWPSLDIFRGLALLMMIAHHFARWTGGRVEERFIGFPGLVVTDLAAPAFALGAGAAAFLVGQQIRPAGRALGDARTARARRALRRYGEVLALGLAIDVAVGGGIDGGGVLPTLAVLGVAVCAASALGLVAPAGWWAVAAVCVVGAVPATAGHPVGFLAELWSGPFSIVVYAVFAAAGAALAAGARGRGEGGLPLLRTAAAVVVVGTAAWLVVPSLVAPEGIWPPARHPGHLAYTMWGLAGSLVLWALVRWAVSESTVLGAGLARAGRRTLLVFGAHYVLKLILQYRGLIGELDTYHWGLAAWGATLVASVLAMLPKPAAREASPTHPAGHVPGPAAAD
ncbi:MAG TPA: heparan-alpha-glucosaminide N-acetyltransferase domain-containing protein [Acidimicrobiales bacterium]|nr:heparan-alpha-glucosaminide N-acetyltransferase domain-containing protein [Acidimicrobiales bacterium]